MYRLLLVIVLLLFPVFGYVQVDFNSQDPNFFKYYGAPNVPIYTTWKDAIKDKEQVIKLQIRGENLSKQFSKIYKLYNLQIAYFENNHLTMLPSQLGALTSLFILVSKDNPISYISPKIADCSSLMYLELWNTKLDSIPNEIQFMRNLELIRILGNTSQDTLHISDSLKRIPRLKTLQIVDADLFKFPEFVLRSKKIENIYLINCKIDSLPSEIFYLENLKELNLEGNRIESIPKEILKMPNLQFLNLRNNKLTSINEFLAYMPSLQVLDIRGNMIPISELDLLRVLFKRKGKILYSDFEKLILEEIEDQKKRLENK